MMQINLMGFILCSGATLSFLLSIGKVAQACSDLPNICEQQRLHWQEMNDVESFDIFIEGKSVAKVEWNEGLMARDQLRECVSARITK